MCTIAGNAGDLRCATDIHERARASIAIFGDRLIIAIPESVLPAENGVASLLLAQRDPVRVRPLDSVRTDV